MCHQRPAVEQEQTQGPVLLSAMQPSAQYLCTKTNTPHTSKTPTENPKQVLQDHDLQKPELVLAPDCPPHGIIVQRKVGINDASCYRRSQQLFFTGPMKIWHKIVEQRSCLDLRARSEEVV